MSSHSEFSDLERPPLHQASLRRTLVVADSLWSRLDVVRSTGSTNLDLRERARSADVAGQILIAEEQLAGRGRLDRTWSAPARSALTLSVLLRPAAVSPSPSPSPWGWLPLLAALAVDDALQRFEVPDVGVKWPNDVLVGERKLAGVLCERVDTDWGAAVVIGMGINVSLRRAELPTAAATSLAIEDATTDREALLRALVRAVEVRYRQWQDGSVDRLRTDYRHRSRTIGKLVRVVLPGGRELRGTALDVDESGGLLLDEGSTVTLVAAADVTHASLDGR